MIYGTKMFILSPNKVNRKAEHAGNLSYPYSVMEKAVVSSPLCSTSAWSMSLSGTVTGSKLVLSKTMKNANSALMVCVFHLCKTARFQHYAHRAKSSLQYRN